VISFQFLFEFDQPVQEIFSPIPTDRLEPFFLEGVFETESSSRKRIEKRYALDAMPLLLVDPSGRDPIAS
jgi:hypothetical protein